MTRARHSIVGVLKSSAGVGAWAGGIYGLLVGSWGPSVFGAGEMPAVVWSPLQTFVLGCLAGVATGAVTGAIVGAVMGLGIYDLLKHEQDAQEVDRLFMNYGAPGSNTPPAVRYSLGGKRPRRQSTTGRKKPADA
ncbi:MAG TPA: hypothetical protein VG125_08140 [Pirellulales bacterium]|nr:hypothetical protein [Pirellulales bacterium]